MKLWHSGLLVVVALLLTGCSTPKLVYGQMDRLIPYYAGRYVTLDERQATQLKRSVAQFRRWHCGTQAALYAQWLRTLNDDVQAGRLDEATVRAHDARVRGYWGGLMQQLGDAVAELALLGSEAQVDELLRRLERENQDIEKSERKGGSEAKRQQRHARHMQQQLEHWLGDLTPAQQRQVSDWGALTAPDVERHRAARVSWQRELRTLLARRDDAVRLRADMRRLFVEPEHAWSPEYVRDNGQRREATLRLLTGLSATLSAEQRAHFARRALSWAQDFDDMKCPGVLGTTGERMNDSAAEVT